MTEDNSSQQQHAIQSWQAVWEESIQHVLYYIVMLLACYGICFGALKLIYPDWSPLKLQKIAGPLSMYPAFIVLIWTSHITVMDGQFWHDVSDDITDEGDRFKNAFMSRTFQSPSSCDLFANVYIATNIVQAIGQLQTERPPLLHQLMIHHIISITCGIAGYYFHRLRWWLSLAGCCEITNLFLIPVYFCKEYYPEWKYKKLYLWNTHCLWWTFITHRMLLFPIWLILWFHDQWRISVGVGKTTVRLHWIESFLYPFTIFGLLTLSAFWLKTISSGLSKQTITYQNSQQTLQPQNKIHDKIS